MDRRNTELGLFVAVALVAATAAFAQTVDPTLPEDAEDEQTMVPEDADDDGELAPEDADEGTASTTGAASVETPPNVSTTPAAAPLRQAAAAPAAADGSPLNVLVIGGTRQAESSEALRGGCWVRLYEGPSFSGNSLTLLGPAEVAQARGPFGMEWEDEVGSIEVGPAATLSAFSDDDFEGTELSFGAARRVTDLADELESLRITCAPAS
jgi:hypothetical protein